MPTPLLLWGYPIQSIAALEAEGVPPEASGMIGISERFDTKRTHPDFDFPWAATYSPEPLPPMPEHVTICLKRVNAVHFDFIPYGDFFILSERLLVFLEDHRFDYAFDRSRASIVNTKGQPLTDETFFLLRRDDLRIGDEVEWVDGDSDGDGEQAITRSEKRVLLSDEDGYESCLFVDATLKATLEQRFRTVHLFTAAEWNRLDDDGWDF
ncbi:hypothetical protein EG850_08445 [Gulosibacter macacae]|uniref:Immunity protein 43 domain-containing protein n=1 Tax=Gulosibacter macacae TaxID=2488791 RepID=A0A3P3VY20_9MICO|nr:hypothetical protein [Gulosibacter macacae]RRJ86369.1 hypothetical protein EG850_08445 [Gulosibacter macacae]